MTGCILKDPNSIRWPPATLKCSHILSDTVSSLSQGRHRTCRCHCFLSTFNKIMIIIIINQPQLAPVGVNNEMWLSDSWTAASSVTGWPDTRPPYKDDDDEY